MKKEKSAKSRQISYFGMCLSLAILLYICAAFMFIFSFAFSIGNSFSEYLHLYYCNSGYGYGYMGDYDGHQEFSSSYIYVDSNADGKYSLLYFCSHDDSQHCIAAGRFLRLSETVQEEDGSWETISTEYAFVSEDMRAKTFTFKNKDTGEEYILSFKKFKSYNKILECGEMYKNIFNGLLSAGAILLVLAVLQTVAAACCKKYWWANDLSVVVGSVCSVFGLGVLGIVGGLKGGRPLREKHNAEKAEKERQFKEYAAANKLSTFTGGAFMNAVIDWTSALVSILTLGICYPFMACWKLKWKASHTFIDGRQQAFDGNGGQFMGRYMLLLFLSVITFGIYYILCAKVAIEKWRTLHTRFADEAPAMEQAGEKLSAFDGKWYQLLGVNWLCNFVTLITLSFGQYWAHCYKERWFCKHRIIDGERLVFDGKAGQYFGKRILWLFLTVITFGVYVFWLKIKTIRWTVSHTHIAV